MAGGEAIRCGYFGILLLVVWLHVCLFLRRNFDVGDDHTPSTLTKELFSTSNSQVW